MTCVAVVAVSPTNWELSNGFVGENVKADLFIPDDCIDLITPDAIGHEIDCKYEINDYGKPELVKVSVVK